MPHRRTISCLIVAAAACAPAALAQDEPGGGAGPVDLMTLVEPLDDAIYEVRAQAEARLVEAEHPSLTRLHRLLDSGGLSPEQHARVRRIAIARFLTTQRAGMGVQFDDSVPGEARIQRVVEGFPAAQIIRAGDRVTMAGGIALEGFGQLGDVILSYDAHDTMPVRLIRDGETLEIDLPLGSYAGLNQGRASNRKLMSAYRIRAQRDGAPGRRASGTLGGGLTLEDWTRAELGGDPPEELPSPGIGSRGGPARGTVVGGGTEATRPAGAAYMGRGSESSASAWMVRRGELARRRMHLELRWAEAEAEGERHEAAETRRRLERCEAQLAEVNRRLGLADEPVTP